MDEKRVEGLALFELGGAGVEVDKKLGDEVAKGEKEPDANGEMWEFEIRKESKLFFFRSF